MAEYSNAAFAKRRTRRRRWPWLALLATILLTVGAGAYTVYWYEAADIVEEAIAAWADDRRGDGFNAEYASLEVSGFPFSFRVDVTRPNFGQSFAPAWTWRTDALVATAKPWNPNRFTIDATSGHDLEYMARGLLQQARFNSNDTSIDVTLRRGVIEGITVRSRNLRLDLDGIVGSVGAARFDIVYTAGGGEKEGPSIALALGDLALPFDGIERLGLSTRIAQIGAAATLTGELPPGPLDRAVTVWRDNGGAIDLSALRLEWGQLRLDGDGTIALDETLRPIGALTAHVLGASETISTLRNAGALSPREAAIARITLRILSKATAGGKLQLPVTAQFGQLFVGPVAVLDIPRMTFPSRRALPGF